MVWGQALSRPHQGEVAGSSCTHAPCVSCTHAPLCILHPWHPVLASFTPLWCVRGDLPYPSRTILFCSAILGIPKAELLLLWAPGRMEKNVRSKLCQHLDSKQLAQFELFCYISPKILPVRHVPPSPHPGPDLCSPSLLLVPSQAFWHAFLGLV